MNPLIREPMTSLERVQAALEGGHGFADQGVHGRPRLDGFAGRVRWMGLRWDSSEDLGLFTRG